MRHLELAKGFEPTAQGELGRRWPRSHPYCWQQLSSSCISSFHLDPLGWSHFALTEAQEDLQSAWPGFVPVPRERHFSPVSMRVLPEEAEEGTVPHTHGGTAWGESCVCLSSGDKAVDNLDSA